MDERTAILNLFLYIPQKEVQKLLQDSKFDYMRKQKKSKSRSTLSATVISDDDSDSEDLSRSTAFEMETDDLFDVQESDVAEIQTEKHVPLPKSINISIICLTISAIVFGSVAIYLLFDFSDDNDDIRSLFHTSIDTRNTAADVTLIDRDVASAMQLCTAFGDDQFQLNYFDLIYSGRRQRALSLFLSLDLTEDQLLALSTVGSYANMFRRLEFISAKLICSIFDVDESLCSRFNNFTYDAQSETSYFRDKLAHDDVVWYSTLEQNLEKSVDDRLNIARNSLYNSRWLNLY
ncbi:hypothetical protein GEMRC1_012338 [Eukaryota sp. GEM-RC1]